jgi:hypothetical protein
MTEKAVKRHPHCGVPGHGPAHRFAAIDCYACMQCDEWLEEKCTDPDCEFCKRRPERPTGGENPYEATPATPFQ